MQDIRTAAGQDHASASEEGSADGLSQDARTPLSRWVTHASDALSTRPMVQDVLVAGALTATSLIGVLAHLHVDIPEGGGDLPYRPLDVLAIVLVLLQTVPLAWRRKAPVIVLSVTTVAMFLFFRLDYLPSFASLGFLVALYTVAAYRASQVSVPAGLASGAAVLAILAIGAEPVEPDAVIAECLIVGAAWSLGHGLRLRRGEVEGLEDRARRLERDRGEWVRQAVGQERRVIARELHDVVAHNVSVIVAQAGAAQRIFDDEPEEARATLGAIEHMGRAALVEMRRLTGFLRTESDGSAMRSPQPGLNDLATLVSQVGDAGLPVHLRVEGTPRPLPAGLDLSAFRIVQEALTNVLKHAGPAHATVVVRFEESELELSISDDGNGAGDRRAQSPMPSYGQLGMQERVALFGGRLDIGPREEGGYAVNVNLPLDAEPS
jgi:signal transduction histidine kinase